MRIRKFIFTICCVVTFSSPALAESMFGYKGAVTKVDIEGRLVTIAPHPKKNQLLMQKALSQSFTKADVWPIEVFRAASEKFVAPVGCGIEKVEAISVIGATWYAVYVCPNDVKLYDLIENQKKELKSGAPLHK